MVACEKRGRSACVRPVVDLYLNHCGEELPLVRKVVAKKVAEKLLGEDDTEKKGKKDKDFAADFINELGYDKCKTSYLRWFLLYSNIFYVQHYNKSGELKDGDENGRAQRFSFKDYYYDPVTKKAKSWDVEHINPQNPPEELYEAAEIKTDKEGSERDKEDNKRFLLRWLREKAKEDYLKEETDKLLNTKDTESIDLTAVSEDMYKLWKECRANLRDNGNDISNLVLLDSETNRGYQNAMFNAKRAFIIRKEQQGTFFLPCTRNVFLKYYSENPERLICWEAEDAEDYGAFLKKMVKHLLESKRQ